MPESNAKSHLTAGISAHGLSVVAFVKAVFVFNGEKIYFVLQTKIKIIHEKTKKSIGSISFAFYIVHKCFVGYPSASGCRIVAGKIPIAFIFWAS